MNILDIAQNSVRAGASLIEIDLFEDSDKKRLLLRIKDDGCGMEEEMAKAVTDPFVTSRDTRKVGLGLPFLKMAAQQTGGELSIESKKGVGTTVTATFTLGHIDLMPLGDIGGTLSALTSANPERDFVYTFKRDGRGFAFDTREARQMLEGVPLSEPAVALFVRDYVNEQMAAVENGPAAGVGKN